MTVSVKKLPVSRRALVARVNRKLAIEGQVLRCSKGYSCRLELGDYFLVDLHSNLITAQHVDLVELAKDQGTLRSFEEPIEA